MLRALKEIGLNDKESHVYLALIELGIGDVTDIAQKTNLGRSNIYVLLGKLIQQGIVTEKPNSKVKQYIPVQPKQVLARAQERVKNFKDMLPIFDALYVRPGDKPSIQYYEGKTAVLNSLKDIYQFRGETIYYIACTERLREVMPEEVDYWTHIHKNNKGAMPAKHLLTQTAADKKFAKAVQPYNQEIRFLPKGKKFDMDFVLYGNTLALTAIDDPMYSVIHQSHAITDSFKLMFELLWENAEIIQL